MEAQSIQTERVDDIPLLFHQLKKMGIQELIDSHWDQHGNWSGLSKGWISVIWLIYILSQADHRMVVVGDWVKSKARLLSELCGREIEAKEFTNDRLAKILKALSDDEKWEALEKSLGRQIIQVYSLKKEVIRVDSTSVPVHHNISENSLFQFGYSKDHRPDLAQYKVMLATLDPMGLPVASLIAPGQEADEKEYLPVIERSRQIVGQGGRLYIGDSKMSGLALRGEIAQANDYYLVPLPRRYQGEDELSQWYQPVLQRQKILQKIWLPDDKGLWALGYEKVRFQSAQLSEDMFKWSERVMMVFRPALARQERAQLDTRLKRAEKELSKLVRQRAYPDPKWKGLEAMQTAAQVILKNHRVEGLLTVSCFRHEEVYKRRRYKDHPAHTELRILEQISIRRNAFAIREKRQLLGWRLYVSNAPQVHLPLAKAILDYRDAPRIELNWKRLKGRSLGLRPVYTQREDHTLGLTRLLLIALRLLTLTEFVVREALHLLDQPLLGLYPGQPTRSTWRPTTERLLHVFKGMDRVIIETEQGTIPHISPLSPVQIRILELLDFPLALYQCLGLDRHTHPP